MTQRREDVRREVTSLTNNMEDFRPTNGNMLVGRETVQRSRSASVSSSDLSQVIDEALIETNVNQNFVVVQEPSLPTLGMSED